MAHRSGVLLNNVRAEGLPARFVVLVSKALRCRQRVEMQKEKAEGRVLRRGKGEAFSAPFEKAPLQRKERGEVGFRVLVESQRLHERFHERGEIELPVARLRLKPCESVETQRADVHGFNHVVSQFQRF